MIFQAETKRSKMIKDWVEKLQLNGHSKESAIARVEAWLNKPTNSIYLDTVFA